MNRHLSIFTPFYIKGRENNLTRALAILLQREPLFFQMIWKKIVGENLNEELLIKDIKIDSQKASTKYDLVEDGIEKVYGVTLNTQKYSTNLEGSKKTKDPITDLSIQLGETLVIIEVKPHGEDPRKQLNNQIDRLNWGENKKNWSYISLTWEEILESVIAIGKFRKNLNSPNVFLNEFNEFIENSYPELLPTSKISINLTSEKIERRIRQIEKEINLKIHGKNYEEEHDFIKLKNCKFAERFKIYLKDGKITLNVWPGDNNKQGSILYKKKFNLKELSEELKSNLNIGNLELGKNYETNIYSYIRFAHIMGKGIYWEHLNFKEDISDIY
ncbi:MAG: hypothetical protein WBG30_00755, partial [Psychrilyobacter sp.]|uniref:hypothetical protein n=1 Tax=Psychrilyobacter sp. TaxID=2586924 RepID=UPI003C747A76